jgi:hypothetical protein
MSGKYAKKSSSCTTGTNSDIWVQSWFFKPLSELPEGNDLIEVSGKPISRDRVCAMFRNCKITQKGSDKNYGNGGGNIVTGDFVGIFDLKDWLLLSLEKDDFFVIPLTRNIEKFHTLIRNQCANFVAVENGGQIHDDTHVANAVGCILQIVTFEICKVLSFKGSKPNNKRLLELVEALNLIVDFTHSVSKYYKEVDNILRLLPHMAGSHDILQAVIFGMIFQEKPTLSIRRIHIANILSRYFKHNGKNSSFVDKTPDGIVGILLVIPMVMEMLNEEFDPTPIITRINTVITTVVEKISVDMTVHEKNKVILQTISMNYIDAVDVTNIYDQVVNKGYYIDSTQLPSFVSTKKMTLRGFNFPMCIPMSITDNEIVCIGKDAREYAHVMVESSIFTITRKLLGNMIDGFGNTNRQHNVSNIRITSGTNCDIRGVNDSISTSGQKFTSGVFVLCFDGEKLDPKLPIEIMTTSHLITIIQGNKTKFTLKKKMNDPVLISFKGCKLTITNKQKVQKKVIISLSEKIQEKINPENGYTSKNSYTSLEDVFL